MRTERLRRISLLLIGLGVASSGVRAQTRFSVQVTDHATNRPVPSVIEYEASPGRWQRIRQTSPDGRLEGMCPGQVSIRANAWPAFRLSGSELCGGAHNIEVSPRSTAEIAQYLVTANGVSLSAWTQANLEATLAEAQTNPDAGTSREIRTLQLYTNDPERLTATQRQALETRALNGSVVSFVRIDTNRDRQISAAELTRAIASPQ